MQYRLLQNTYHFISFMRSSETVGNTDTLSHKIRDYFNHLMLVNIKYENRRSDGGLFQYFIQFDHHFAGKFFIYS